MHLSERRQQWMLEGFFWLWGNEERSAVIYLYSASTPACCWRREEGDWWRGEAPRCLSVFTSPPHQLIAREEVGEANSVVWEAGSGKRNDADEWPLPTTVMDIPCRLGWVRWRRWCDDKQGDRFRPTSSCCLTALFVCPSQVISIQLGQTDLGEWENERYCRGSQAMSRTAFNIVLIQIYAFIGLQWLMCHQN